MTKLEKHYIINEVVEGVSSGQVQNLRRSRPHDSERLAMRRRGQLTLTMASLIMSVNTSQ